MSWIEEEVEVLIALGIGEANRRLEQQKSTAFQAVPFVMYAQHWEMAMISAFGFDYQFMEFDVSGRSSPTDALVPEGSPYHYGTLNGVVVHGSKVTNKLWALWGRAVGYTESNLRLGAHINQLKSMELDPPSSQAAIMLGSAIYDTYREYGQNGVFKFCIDCFLKAGRMFVHGSEGEAGV